MRVYIDLMHMMILLATIVIIIYMGHTLFWHACMMCCYFFNSILMVRTCKTINQISNPDI